MNVDNYKFYVIYHGTSDYPEDYYIVRGWSLSSQKISIDFIPDETPLYVGDSLDQAREAIQGLEFQYIKFPPYKKDDPVIKEIWL